MDKYTRWYNQIVDRARFRITEDYTETHHIQPRSLGGSDTIDNLVELTAREHFICHWLLTKITTGEDKAKMIYALNGMKRSNKFAQRYETKITARVYESLKKEFSAVHSATMKGRKPWNVGIPITEEQREKNRKSATGKKRSAEAIAKTVAKQTGQKRSQETKDKISSALKGKSKPPKSEEEKIRISNSLKGRSKPPGMGAKLSATVAAQKAAGTHYSQIKLTCPHCGIQASKARYNGYHGDKCKRKAS
jgi:5-methylcytosine-specific restriction endonuclease McrA